MQNLSVTCIYIDSKSKYYWNHASLCKGNTNVTMLKKISDLCLRGGVQCFLIVLCLSFKTLIIRFIRKRHWFKVQENNFIFIHTEQQHLKHATKLFSYTAVRSTSKRRIDLFWNNRLSSIKFSCMTKNPEHAKYKDLQQITNNSQKSITQLLWTNLEHSVAWLTGSRHLTALFCNPCNQNIRFVKNNYI